MTISTSTPPPIGVPRIVDDLLVTLTPIPDAFQTQPRGVRRRGRDQISEWISAHHRPTSQAKPNRLEAAALTAAGTIRATISVEDGPAGLGDDGATHWHVAVSLLVHEGTRRPAPSHELALWVAMGWPSLVGAAIDTYVMETLPTARHIHIPREAIRPPRR